VSATVLLWLYPALHACPGILVGALLTGTVEHGGAPAAMKCKGQDFV
jgi:hypothetical protein